MADAKNKKTTASKKIVDVKHEGDGASGSSRSIIVNNRPILKDPMMAEVSKLTGGGSDSSEPEDTSSGAAASKQEPKEQQDAAKSPATTRTKIEPLKKDEKQVDSSDDTAADGSAAESQPELDAPDKPTAPETSKADTKADDTSDESSGDSEKVAVKVKVTPAKSQDSTDDSAPTDDTVDAPDENSEPPESETSDDSKVDTTDSANDVSDGDDQTPQSKPESSTGTAMPGDPVKDENSAVQPGRSFDDSVEQAGAAKQPEAPSDDGVDDKKPEKPDYAKLTPEQEKAVESGEFFLPIKTAEGKRLRREITVAVLIVLVLTVIWVDIMLDAGLISLGGIEAPTNFFN